jgi:hypothetical protein
MLGRKRLKDTTRWQLIPDFSRKSKGNLTRPCRPLNPENAMSEEEIIELLRTRLRLNVKAGSSYTGGMDGGPMYRPTQTIQLLLDDEVIAETDLDP